MTDEAPVMIMAGGTGGHVFPALAVAEWLRRRDVPVVWMGTRRGLEATLVPKAGIPVEWIGVAGLRSSGWRRGLMAPVMLAQALGQAAVALGRCRPRVVLGMGGFVSGPGGLMAWLRRIPLVIHEQNAVAGLTNRWLARFADQVLEAFPDSFPAARHARCTGNPVRQAIADLLPPAARFAGRRGPARLLVVGGSQGALALNQLVPQALARLPERPEVWHQAGGRLLEAARTAYAQAGVSARLEPFIDDMAGAYGWADLVLCRAGALTVAELAAAGVGAVLVPFPYAVDDHQT
ncbi:MAG: undecaprenyldiphospho-muramoylpentapeptide beta-N-acetylglucosaminyltransferase, partial [Pseudomonadota bacterium]|nr:undecaprenyldiphospho-muramoylpentapeptide beta-N-acetylglucosaminyltransferase [Pseudomonadota bacterium]